LNFYAAGPVLADEHATNFRRGRGSRVLTNLAHDFTAYNQGRL
jgi:hypothetical protein